MTEKELRDAARKEFAEGVALERAKIDVRIGRSWVIPPPLHVGHTLTVSERDLWIECSCGDRFLVGESHIDRYIADEDDNYCKHEDQYHRLPRVAQDVGLRRLRPAAVPQEKP